MVFAMAAVTLSWPWGASVEAAEGEFAGTYLEGKGDVEYLELLDFSRRVFDPNPEYQHLAMLYTPVWNGLVEGPTWGAWWIQNSYGTSYAALPFLQEPFVTFLKNSQDLWFSQMGDGKTPRPFGRFRLVPPDGCLCDAASPGWFVAKQGDGRVDIHDWGLEFTAAGLLMKAEALLVSRDVEALPYYLPRLRRCAAFIESRRDPKNDLFLAGPAANLLAPSYAGCRQPDGTYGQAYLVGLSVTYVAALDRLIELERMAGATEQVRLQTERRDRARLALGRVTTSEGYLIKSLDPDGTRHGVYGAARHGYFEAVCNHDAVAFRVADDRLSESIYARLSSIPGLRPHGLIITNFPSLDDMYERPTGLWEFGRWVNGGHWTTCEARMILAYDRLGKYDDVRRSLREIRECFRRFRTDNPLVDFGGNVYQPGEPINCIYDTWGAPAAMVRGLFEYLYRADGLTLVPHIPSSVTSLRQKFPIRFGNKRVFLSTNGSGPITGVVINGAVHRGHDTRTVSLNFEQTPPEAEVQILFGGATARPSVPRPTSPVPTTEAPRGFAGQVGSLFPVISSNSLPLRIGAASHGENRFRGDLARVQVFGRALTAVEIAELAGENPGHFDHDASLVGDWQCGEFEGGVLKDRATSRLGAKVVGTIGTVDSPHGRAARLDGGGFFEVTHDPRLDLKSMTLAAWVRPDAIGPPGGRIIDKSRVGTSNGYLPDAFPSGSFRMIVERGTLTGSVAQKKGGWYHVAATADDGGRLALYVDGRSVAGEARPAHAEIASLESLTARLHRFESALRSAGLGTIYEATHARLSVQCTQVAVEHRKLVELGRLPKLAPESQLAADRSYFSTATKVAEGLARVVEGYKGTRSPERQRLHQIWQQTSEAGTGR